MLPTIWKSKGSLLNHDFDDVVERFFYGWPESASKSDVLWTPRVDVNETDKEILLDVEVPGMDKKDVKVEVKDNTLHISGERKNERKTENAESCRIERHYGKFERSFSLPDTVDSNKITASYKDGILEIKLEKTEKAKPKEIAVEVK